MGCAIDRSLYLIEKESISAVFDIVQNGFRCYIVEKLVDDAFAECVENEERENIGYIEGAFACNAEHRALIHIEKPLLTMEEQWLFCERVWKEER